MNEVTVKFEKTHEDAIIPEIAYEGDACFDLFAVEDTVIPPATTSFKTANLPVSDMVLNHLMGSADSLYLINHNDQNLPCLPELMSDLSHYKAIGYTGVELGKNFVPVGLKMELPMGWEATFRTRSSFGIKNCLRVHPGTIDAGFRGELSVAVYNMSSEPVLIKKGQGVAQVAIRPVPKVNIIEGAIGLNSQRGEKGFGSSDKV